MGNIKKSSNTVFPSCRRSKKWIYRNRRRNLKKALSQTSSQFQKRQQSGTVSIKSEIDSGNSD